MLNRYKELLEVKSILRGTATEILIDKELRDEAKAIRAKFKIWKKQFKNALFYTDSKKVGKRAKRELFFRGLDPVEAIDYLLKKNDTKEIY